MKVCPTCGWTESRDAGLMPLTPNPRYPGPEYDPDLRLTMVCRDDFHLRTQPEESPDA